MMRGPDPGHPRKLQLHRLCYCDPIAHEVEVWAGSPVRDRGERSNSSVVFQYVSCNVPPTGRSER